MTLIIESNVLIHKCLGFVIDRTFHDHDCTEVEEFVDKKVRRRAQTERGNTCGGAKKKVRDFTQPVIHKSKLLSS